MTTLLTSLACIWFAYLIFRAITIEVALRKMAKRNKSKQELGEKIQRKINRCIEVNLHAIDERLSGDDNFANDLSRIGEEEHEEIKELMKQLDLM